MIPRLVLIAAAVILVPAAAFAGPATEVVKKFYAPVGFEADLAKRGYFVDPAKAVFEKYDRQAKDGGEVACIDFDLAIDAQDFDQGELHRTLRFDETVTGDTADVRAVFSILPDDPASKRMIDWYLKKVGNDWKISDIESRSGDWRLSSFDCG